MKKYFRSLCLCAFVVFPLLLSAETLDMLERNIRETDRQITALEKEYGKEQQSNEERIRKSQMKQAYASSERLHEINHLLNGLRGKRDSLCNQWRELYRNEADQLLGAAESEQRKDRKIEIGKQLIQLQTRNSRFCPESPGPLPSHEWKSIRIENYDGPQEIQQKTQLLRDLSRETSIGLTKLDGQYQNALKERRTRERAQEFIQEGTLFNDSAGIRSPTFTTAAAGPGGTGVEVVDRPSSVDSNPSNASGSPAFQKDVSKQQLESEYKKKRAELLSQQEELKKRIEEFNRTARSLIP